MAKCEYVRDGRITDFNELFELAAEKKPVIWIAGFRVNRDFVRPAAFFLQWSLAKLKNTQLYRAKKVEYGTESVRK